jgi:predicted RNase H-like nuclease (RuvC/YqgF family)
MKARDWRMVLAVLAASIMVTGCGMVSKQKYEEADARAAKATTSLNEMTAALEKVKVENEKLVASLKQKNEQIVTIKAEAKKATEELKAEFKKVSDELKAAHEQVAAITKDLEQAKVKVKEAEQLVASIQKLTLENKQLQATIEKLKSMAVPKAEPNAPAAGPVRR